MGKRAKRGEQSKAQKPEKPKTYEEARTEAEEKAEEKARKLLPGNFSEIPRFTIDTREEKEGEGEEGEGGEPLEEKLQKFFTEVTGQFNDVSSTTCEGVSVTPPSLDKEAKTTYHIVVIVSKEGILEVLVRTVDGYVIAFRKQPEDPNTKSGWNLFFDIKLPAHLFGEENENYRMTFFSGYKYPENVRVGEGFLDTVVNILVRYDKNNYKEETDERFNAIQTLFVVCGEGQRLPMIRWFLIRNLRAARWIALGPLVIWSNHWLKLSKGILHLKLFLLARALKDVRKKLAAAVEAELQLACAEEFLKCYKDANIPLTPNAFLKKGNLGRSVPTLPRLCEKKDPNDELSLALLISYVQLIKYEKILVPHIIMRETGYTGVLPEP